MTWRVHPTMTVPHCVAASLDEDTEAVLSAREDPFRDSESRMTLRFAYRSNLRRASFDGGLLSRIGCANCLLVHVADPPVDFDAAEKYTCPSCECDVVILEVAKRPASHHE